MKIDENTQNIINLMVKVDNKEDLIKFYIRGLKKNASDNYMLRESL